MSPVQSSPAPRPTHTTTRSLACARCALVLLTERAVSAQEQQAPVYTVTLRTGPATDQAREAFTVIDGQALCLGHLHEHLTGQMTAPTR